MKAERLLAVIHMRGDWSRDQGVRVEMWSDSEIILNLKQISLLQDWIWDIRESVELRQSKSQLKI